MIREVLLAAATVLGGAVDMTVDPHVAVIEWSDGTYEEIATINRSQCDGIPAAVTSGRWRPLSREGRTIVNFDCQHRGGFAPGWDGIKGYNR